MDLEQLRDDVWDRVVPASGLDAGWWALLALAVALVAVVVPVIWLRARLAVTIVHELGHAVIGMLLGRRFTGFVVSADMSGHAVTVGPRRGFGRVASTWAGYPAPAVVGALLVQLAFGGWAGAVLLAALVVLVLSVVFARSAHTVLTVLVTAALVAAVWWWGGPLGAACLLLGAGVLLLLGAWRHLGSVIATGGRHDDPGQLAELTGVPAWLWNGTFVLVIGACTFWGWTALSPHLM
ncbi:M50 family metallopeptidase [Brachybacterium phenoliresistens]|uniref:Membrane protein n=1 Tax=Brachybacterium phenoliresistens TaxID=396014 RepID=Z9JNU2_9MICO|nr:M50 family metallopeptidase [Brachybacterium phenoliresistens]EWS79859.1 membrane protein [Brachybacterium phenoliresistens]